MINIETRMEFVYLLVIDGGEWEDMIIIVTEEEAIQASLKYQKSRVEIFSKNDNLGYVPTYNYYEKGILVKND